MVVEADGARLAAHDLNNGTESGNHSFGARPESPVAEGRTEQKTRVNPRKVLVQGPPYAYEEAHPCLAAKYTFVMQCA